MTPYIEIAFILVFAVMIFTAYVRDEYDAERWKLGDPDYCRYQASFRQVLSWWWRR